MDPLLQVQNLEIHYSTAQGIFKVINDVSFTLKKEETFCLIGESGCGKSTIALSIMRMLGDHAKIAGGRILLDNIDLLQLGQNEMNKIWGRKIFMIFQNPMTSLNPLMKISDQIREVLIRRENGKLKKREVIEGGLELLEQVEVPDPKRVMGQFPHQLSGGMNQRIMIAMGVCLNPNLLILDEPTTALDSTIQFKMIELIWNLKAKKKISQILITHDVGVAAKLCDRVAVMYAGKILEQGRYTVVLKEAAHPYTQGLFKSIVTPKSKSAVLETIPGILPDLSQLPKGCYFENRCKISRSICQEQQPPLRDIGNEHFVACHQINIE
jgi:peptide/nickel transport system ATP-binding protein